MYIFFDSTYMFFYGKSKMYTIYQKEMRNFAYTFTGKIYKQHYSDSLFCDLTV